MHVEQQEMDKWCWAAVSVSVDRYFAPGSASTQCRVAAQVLGIDQCYDNCDACNSAQRLEDGLQAVGRPPQKLTNPVTFDEIQRQIDAHLPVCVRIGWFSGGGHFVVITGYRETEWGEQLVEVADPLFPDSTIPYDILVSAYQNAEVPQGGGQWTHTYLLAT